MQPALAVTNRREVVLYAVRLFAVVVAIITIFFVAPFGEPSTTATWIRASISFLLLGVVIALETVAVLRSDRPGRRAVRALAVMVSLLLVVSASVYRMISANDPAAFTEPLEDVDALYLAMMTLTTVGFGDIGAVSTGARIAVMLQMVFNVVALGVSTKVVLDRVQQARRGVYGARFPGPADPRVDGSTS